MIKVKFHLHHSLSYTGKIQGYAHDFCNTAVIKETAPDIPFIAHNLFGFDLYYFIKAYIASAWYYKSLNIGGTNFTQVNFGNIAGEIKLIDTLKLYQKSLADLASTLSDEEIMPVKKVTDKFLNESFYFSPIWPYLSFKKKEKIFDIIVEGKGVIPYKLIVDMKSFFIKPENDFWEKTGFFSELKQSAVNDEDYENSKYLYQTLKTRNLGDLNVLYKAQDVILLCEIIENRFQAMKDTYGFNPRRCNSASSMSGCIEREMSKLYLPYQQNTIMLKFLNKRLQAVLDL